MKTKITILKTITSLMFLTLILGTINIAFAQTDTSWQAIGADTIVTNKHVQINNNMRVHGKITTDSLRVRGALHIGDSSLTLVDDVFDFGTNATSDHIRSTQGRIAFMGDNGAGGYNTNLNIGIGVHNPTARIHLNYNNTGTLKIGSGNRAIEGGNSAGNLNIESTNTLALNQYSTGNTTIVRGGGKVGIGTDTPASKLDVEGGISIGNQYAGSTPAPANGAIIQGRVGIGTNSPNSSLHINSTGNAVYTQTTNNATGTGNNDGLKVGIENNGQASIIQQEAQDIAIYTAGSAPVNKRITIKGTAGATQGNVGINNTNPQNRLEITSVSTDPSLSGLRFTNLTNAS
ncbi:MAG: hypothetical protein WBM13_04940, partial [Bacteroidia bacterium]